MRLCIKFPWPEMAISKKWTNCIPRQALRAEDLVGVYGLRLRYACSDKLHTCCSLLQRVCGLYMRSKRYNPSRTTTHERKDLVL